MTYSHSQALPTSHHVCHSADQMSMSSSRRNLDFAFPPFAPDLPSVYERAGFDVNKLRSPRSGDSSRANSPSIRSTRSGRHKFAGRSPQLHPNSHASATSLPAMLHKEPPRPSSVSERGRSGYASKHHGPPSDVFEFTARSRNSSPSRVSEAPRPATASTSHGSQNTHNVQSPNVPLYTYAPPNPSIHHEDAQSGGTRTEHSGSYVPAQPASDSYPAAAAHPRDFPSNFSDAGNYSVTPSYEADDDTANYSSDNYPPAETQYDLGSYHGVVDAANDRRYNREMPVHQVDSAAVPNAYHNEESRQHSVGQEVYERSDYSHDLHGGQDYEAQNYAQDKPASRDVYEARDYSHNNPHHSQDKPASRDVYEARDYSYNNPHRGQDYESQNYAQDKPTRQDVYEPLHSHNDTPISADQNNYEPQSYSNDDRGQNNYEPQSYSNDDRGQDNYEPQSYSNDHRGQDVYHPLDRSYDELQYSSNDKPLSEDHNGYKPLGYPHDGPYHREETRQARDSAYTTVDDSQDFTSDTERSLSTGKHTFNSHSSTDSRFGAPKYAPGAQAAHKQFEKLPEPTPVGLGLQDRLSVDKGDINRFSTTSSIYTKENSTPSMRDSRFPEMFPASSLPPVQDFQSPRPQHSGVSPKPLMHQNSYEPSRRAPQPPDAAPALAPGKPPYSVSMLPPQSNLTPEGQSKPVKQPKTCRGCHERIHGKSLYSRDGNMSGRWHRECFKCTHCATPLSDDVYVLSDNPYCQDCYHTVNESTCRYCGTGIEGDCLETQIAGEANDPLPVVRYHLQCLKCNSCANPLYELYYDINGSTYCAEHVDSAMLHNEKAQKRITRLMML